MLLFLFSFEKTQKNTTQVPKWCSRTHMSNAAPSPSVPIVVSMPGSSLSTVTVTGNPVVDSVIDVHPQTNHSIPSSSVVVVLDLATQGAFREDGVTIPGSDLRENSVVDYVIGVEPPLPLPANHLTNSPSPSVNRFIVISNLTPAMASLRQTLAQRAFGEEQDGFITETNHPTSTTNLPSPSISYLMSLRHRRTQGPIQEHGVTMPALSTVSNNPVVEFVITNIEPPLPLPLPVAEINHQTSSTTNFPSLSVNRFMVILNLAAGRPLASLRRLWTQRAFGGDGVINPGSALSFVIGGLYNFLEIKAQGQSGFPFTTHPQAIMVAVTSLIIFGLISAAERILSTARYPFYCTLCFSGRPSTKESKIGIKTTRLHVSVKL